VILTKSEFEAILHARHGSAHSVLGMHPLTYRRSRGLVVRALLQDAVACEVILTDETPPAVFPMKLLAPEGLFEVFIPKHPDVRVYELRATSADGRVRQFRDPYCFLPTLGDQDLYLFNEGNEHRIYNKLGSHLRDLGGVKGTAFAVWAPSAARVSVVGDFNGWDGRYHTMRSLGASGVWEIFIPGLESGSLYKFEIRDSHGSIRVKTDPYGTRFEPPPGNAAIVCAADGFTWTDGDWITKRSTRSWNTDTPMSIYEVHLGSWRRKPEEGNRPLTYREAAPQLADYAN